MTVHSFVHFLCRILITLQVSLVEFLYFRPLLSQLVTDAVNSLVLSLAKGKAVPFQAWSGPEGSRKLRFTRFHDNGTGWW